MTNTGAAGNGMGNLFGEELRELEPREEDLGPGAKLLRGFALSWEAEVLAGVRGGASRLRYHGVLALQEGTHSSFGGCRVNLTFRKAG